MSTVHIGREAIKKAAILKIPGTPNNGPKDMPYGNIPRRELQEAKNAVVQMAKEIADTNNRLAAECSRGIPAWRFGVLLWKACKVFEEKTAIQLLRYCDNCSRREIESSIEKFNSKNPPTMLGDLINVPNDRVKHELLIDFFEAYMGAVEEQDLLTNRSHSKLALIFSGVSIFIALASLLVAILN